MKTKYIWLLLLALGFIACDSDDDSSDGDMTETLPALTAGSANLSKYVSLGSSITAGFSDGALFTAAQQNSYPNILATQFSLAGGGSFTQPLMNDNTGGLLAGGNQIAPNRLVVIGLEPPVPLADVIGPVTPTTDLFVNNPTGPFGNMGVPLAKSFHLLAPGYGNIGNLSLGLANPFFVRMTGSTPDASVLGLAMAQAPTFFSAWIGNYDVLDYALKGGDETISAITPSDGPPGVGFDQTYGAIIATLTSGGAQGIVANIPYPTDFSHFTAVQYNVLDPTNPAFGPLIPTLNGIFGQLNQVYAFLESQGVPNATERQIVFSETENSGVVIQDENLVNLSAQITGVLNASPTFPAFVESFGLPAAAAPLVANLFGIYYGQSRQSNENDLLPLPASSIIGTVNPDAFAFLMSQGLPAELAGQFSVEGISLPLEDKWVLIPSEQGEIKTATNNFNATIQAMASQAGLAFVDANAIVTELKTSGIASGDFIFTADLISGGAISADGFSLTSRGAALFSNGMMLAIDDVYGSNFEASGNLVNVGDYPTNYSPLLP